MNINNYQTSKLSGREQQPQQQQQQLQAQIPVQQQQQPPLVVYRTPPPPPIQNVDHQQVVTPSSLPHLPPQPPARTNIKTNLQHHHHHHQQQQNYQHHSNILNDGIKSHSNVNDHKTAVSALINASNIIAANSPNTQNNNNINNLGGSKTTAHMANLNTNQHENATDAATRLVYKTVMMGSVPSLNTNSNNSNTNTASSNTANTTSSSTTTTNNNNNNNQLMNNSLNDSESSSNNFKNLSMSENTNKQNQEMAGVLSTSGDNKTHSSSQSIGAENKISRSSPSSKANLARNSSSVGSSSRQNLPWIPINGEYIVNKDENEPVFSEIIFVMPDNRGIRGKLYISNFRLYFRSDDTYSFTIYQSNFIIDLPLGLINRIEKIGHQSSKQVNFYGILISCKNGRRLRFANTQSKTSRKQIYELLQKHAFPLSNGLSLFAFCYNQQFLDNTGWYVYDVKQEYERMGISKSNDWRFSNVNNDYRFCETYPKVLVVPQVIKDDELRQVAEFRSKHRIPVVSWLKYDNRKNSVALLRSSQPLVGLTQKRNEKDENYLHTLFKINSVNSLDKLFIVDARPLVNAMANRTTGGGYESDDHYKDCEISFLNIHNIHVMRESLRKIFDMAMPTAMAAAGGGSGGGAGSNSASSQQQSTSMSTATNQNAATQNVAMNANAHHRSISYGGNGSFGVAGNLNNSANHSNFQNDDKNFFVNLENSKWLEHIRSILNGVLKIVKLINVHQASVLVHCSDGWDRSAQLTSLSMLMMDKYYRTLVGFEVLIEKEWLSFGHRFGTRMGHGSDKYSDQDRSPIFLQFIDCVWQIMQQNSKVFEFNEKFLLTIVNNMYTCQFGTFLYNNEYEREKNDVKNKTVSLWSYINSYKIEFKNSAYVEYDGVVECSTAMPILQLWTAYYFQYKEIIDDSVSEATLNSMSIHALNSKNSSSSQNSYTFAPPMASSKIFGQGFFQQVVNQMKASVRNHATQEPELVKYKAVVKPSDMS